MTNQPAAVPVQRRNLIRVSETVKRQLWRMAAEQRAESGRAVSMSDVIEQLLARQAGES